MTTKIHLFCKQSKNKRIKWEKEKEGEKGKEKGKENLLKLKSFFSSLIPFDIIEERE